MKAAKPPPPTLDLKSQLEALAKDLQGAAIRRGHTPLRCGLSFECPRCGLSASVGVLSTPNGNSVVVSGPLFETVTRCGA